MKYFTISAFLLSAFISLAQTTEDRKKIVAGTDVKKLLELQKEFRAEQVERDIRVANYLKDNPNVSFRTEENGKVKEIYDYLNGEVWYYGTSNFYSALTSRTNRLYNNGGLGLNIQGQNMNAYVWDNGNSRATHREFPNNKVMNVENTEMMSHATHVMGTMVAQGLSNSSRGIAFDANGYSYKWDNDYAEMTGEAAGAMLVSNHSYWISPTSNFARWMFGAYDYRAMRFDEIAVAAPYYLAVTAAGNDRNDRAGIVGAQYNSKGGYDMIRGMQNAKNFLTVGAVEQVLNYTGPSSVTMSDFSSWGPTDDGRIKPEIVTKGVAVMSTGHLSNNEYLSSQGTSMASPAVAGNALLLQQYYKSLNDNNMRAATLKGLILHTALEAGDYPGPDYMFGFGLINAEAAANLITAKQNQTAVMEELVLNNLGTYTKTISVTAGKPLVVSISWTDPAYHTSNGGSLDPSTKYLVNDLDLRVTRNGVTYFPWTLNPSAVSDAAVRTADNNRDNYEKIEIDAPAAGTYTITVTHKGNLKSGQPQNFSLIASGNEMSLSDKDFSFTEDAITVFPNPTIDVLNFTVGNTLEVDNVSIVDLSGKTIPVNFMQGQSSINVAHLQSGVYFVKFATDKNVIVKKFIKK